MLVLEGSAYISGGFQRCAVGIEDGKIVAVKKALRGEKHVDYGDRLLLPGAVDIHVHFREPGLTYKEDFQSGSIAAASGGVTTVFDMPNTLPPTVTLRDYSSKVEMIKGRSLTDFGIFSSVSRARELPRLVKVGAPLKLYMAPTTGELAVSDDDLDSLLQSIPEKATPIVAHAEDPSKFREAVVKNLKEHDLSRPVASECASVEKLASKGRRFHVTHITSEAALGIAATSGFTTDATPHHMLLDTSSRIGQLGKVNPPLRNPSERDGLWRAFRDGRVDMLASDHAPHTEEEKGLSFRDAPSGMPGVETMLPLMLRRVRSEELTIDKLVNAACERPAELMGLKKGRIEVGFDADIQAVDLRVVSRIRGSRIHSKCGWTAFEGFEGVFPRAVYLRGSLIVEEGEVVEDNIGRLVTASISR